MPWHEFAIGLPGTPPDSFVHIRQLIPEDRITVVRSNGTSHFHAGNDSKLVEIFIARQRVEETYSLTVEPPKFLELPVDPLSCKDARLRTALVFMPEGVSNDFSLNAQLSKPAGKENS